MTTADAYREGLAYGRRLWDWRESSVTRASERALRLEVKIAGARPIDRARALGELRGYRQAQP